MEEGLDASLREHIESIKGRHLPPGTLNERLQELRECILRLRERWLRELKAAEEQAALELYPQDAEAQVAWISQQDTEAAAAQMGETFRKQYDKKGRYHE